ncbi:MAG: 3-beta-hydroxy-Delta(5)-steroid dehydrogenase [Rhodomicrobium sp.]|nr:MAG: 3-beta-hydroxy-Delta(5)-steroid dehydrogenase [Rhodomicrobium sp.]
MNDKGLVTIFGGSGFIGRHLVQQLAREGYRIRIAVRRPELANFLQPLGSVSQIEAVHTNIRDEHSIKEATKGADYVVNLCGILAPKGGQTFNNIHVQGARLIAIAAREAEAKRLVHISALGANSESNSSYARSKAHGEDAVLNMEPNAIILRPSVVFGPEDEFFNRFAGLMSMAPIVPVFASKTKFQPVYVEDVARAIAAALDGKAAPGTIYELGGPEALTMRQIHEKIKEITGLGTGLLPLPLWIASLIALVTSPFPFAPITRDQVKLLKQDNIPSEAAIAEHRVPEALISTRPQSVSAIVPQYLGRFETHRHALKRHLR